MIDVGLLTDEDKVELLNGYVVLKMARNPPNDSAISALTHLIPKLIPSDWTLRVQSAVTFMTSEPEPDILIARGPWRDYNVRHPAASDIGLLAEVADSSLSRDRDEKLPIYAEAGVVEYWIVNLIDLQIEVYSNPAGAGLSATYRVKNVFRAGQTIPVVLDGVTVGQIAVSDVLP